MVMPRFTLPKMPRDFGVESIPCSCDVQPRLTILAVAGTFESFTELTCERNQPRGVAAGTLKYVEGFVGRRGEPVDAAVERFEIQLLSEPSMAEPLSRQIKQRVQYVGKPVPCDPRIERSVFCVS